MKKCINSLLLLLLCISCIPLAIDYGGSANFYIQNSLAEEIEVTFTTNMGLNSETEVVSITALSTVKINSSFV
jgi:hypothetical protein